MDVQAMDDFKAVSTKYYLQFVEDAKDHPRLPEAHSSFMSLMSLADFVFNISIEFLKVKKEERASNSKNPEALKTKAPVDVAIDCIASLENSQF